MSDIHDIELTEREKAVLLWIAEGWTNQQVADKLGIGLKAVEFCLARIYSKLGVSSRLHASLAAARLGLLPPFPLSHGASHKVVTH